MLPNIQIRFKIQIGFPFTWNILWLNACSNLTDLQPQVDNLVLVFKIYIYIYQKYNIMETLVRKKNIVYDHFRLG